MVSAIEVIKRISGTSSSTEKIRLLKTYEGVDDLKDILKFIYNPYCKTGISYKKLSKFADCTSDKFISYKEAIEYFKQHTTGTDADCMFAAKFVNCYSDEDAWLAMAIVTQNLKVGVTSTTLNNVYGSSFIPKVGCMLGTPYADVAQKTKWPCIVTEKLDGIRRVLIKENGIVRAFSRSGHEDTGLVDIFEEAKYLPDNTVYDGELLAIGDFSDSIALRQATNSIANSSGNKTGLTFNVFDMLPLEEYNMGISKWDALSRKIRLAATFSDDSVKHLTEEPYKAICCYMVDYNFRFIRPVPILGLANAMHEVEPIVADIWKAGGEGVMLNTTVGLYEIKRSKELLKVKHTEEYCLPIVGTIEGTGKFENMLGALVVEYKGYKLGVGSGFTDAQRITLWNNREGIIGKNVEIETFGESKNMMGDVSLNCPIFKRIEGDIE